MKRTKNPKKKSVADNLGRIRIRILDWIQNSANLDVEWIQLWTLSL